MPSCRWLSQWHACWTPPRDRGPSQATTGGSTSVGWSGEWLRQGNTTGGTLPYRLRTTGCGVGRGRWPCTCRRGYVMPGSCHLVSRWGYLQFVGKLGDTAIGPHREWTVRQVTSGLPYHLQVSMAIYYAEKRYSTLSGGKFTNDLLLLLPHLLWPTTDPDVLLGGCSELPQITLG